MSIITYPLDGVTYSAEDVATYLCTRTSGVYAKNSNFAASITGTRQVTIAPGLAWMNYDDFKGVSVCSREDTVLTVPDADNTLNRVDRVVLQFDTASNLTAIRLKTGTPAVAAQPPDILQNHNQYELGLCTISVPAGSAAISAADVTDTRADETVCGVMRDGVTGIPTQQLLAEARARIGQLEETASTSAAAADKSAKAAAASQSAAAGSASTANTNAAAAASSASTAQSAASTATKQATTATEQATAAASSASAAKTSESNAKTSETAAADHLQATKEYFEQVRTITIGAQGWYATPEALKAAVPVGENGWWAVVGTTDTIWTWDSDTGAWKDSVQKADMSDFYTQAQVDALLKEQQLKDHPVGSAFFTISDDDPAQLFGGTWMKVASDRAIMGASTTHPAGTTVEAGLPNIRGTFAGIARWNLGDNPASGAFTGIAKQGPEGLYAGNGMAYKFNAANYNGIYGASDTVQPPAYYFNIWIRVT
jgi:hypothetical protein